MGFKRTLWGDQFLRLPNWVCPYCEHGTLSLIQKSLHILETGPSIENWQYTSDPADKLERFSGLLQCQDSECGEIASIGGNIVHQEYLDEYQDKYMIRPIYEPHFISPAPPIFLIPEKCPESISKEIKKAFFLYWADAASSANKLRTATEALLTTKGIAKTKLTKKGRQRLSLHERIAIYKGIDKESADYLLAIKWLGNIGSHTTSDNLNKNDIFDGFELFEHVINKLYSKRENELNKIAKKITARKGKPAKKKRKYKKTP